MSPQNVYVLVLVIVFGIFLIGSRRQRKSARTRSSHFPGFSQLEPLEKRLLIEFFSLRYTELWVESTWQLAIHNVITTGFTPDFRKLCVQLWSQAQDAPDVMITIIGSDAYDLLRLQMQNGIVRHISDHLNDSGVHTEWGPFDGNDPGDEQHSFTSNF